MPHQWQAVVQGGVVIYDGPSFNNAVMAAVAYSGIVAVVNQRVGSVYAFNGGTLVGKVR